MDLPHAAVLFLSLAIFLRPPTAASFNITAILENYKRFSTFNHELSRTNLVTKINKGQTITVCVVDDSVMADLESKNLDLATMKNVLSLHVLVDYFEATKLHSIDGSAEVSTMFQATGSATGSSGIVNITNAHGGIVNFTTQDGNGVVVGNATFVKDIHQEPYNISVIQISAILNSPVALAPSPPPPPPPPANLTANMSAHGCKVFAEILANSSAQRTFDDNTESGLTVFCPGDDVMTKFLPQFRNLSEGGKLSLLEYHGIPIYQTMAELRSTNNLARTLASSGKGSYEFRLQNNGTDVLIQTKVVTAHIGKSVFDSQNQVAIFQVDKVLMPAELFNSTLAPSASPVPAPAPGPGASSPKPSSHDSPPSPPAPPADNPADSPADEPTADDQTEHRNGAAKFYGGGVGAVILSLWFVFLQL